MSLPEIPSQPGESLHKAADEMIANGYRVADELCERALASTAEPFHIHVFSWLASDGPDSARLMVAGYWHVADELGFIKHDFGEEMPGWRSAAPASTDCTIDASQEERAGDADASTP